MNDNYPSKLLQRAVEQFTKLPGIGERTALRLVLFLLRLKKEDALDFTRNLQQFIEEIKFCRICNNISDSDCCTICSDPRRAQNTLCVVENIKDVMAIENTSQYFGLYHVLGGIISPMEGIGPGDLSIDLLLERLKQNTVEEVIFALSATMEGDTTNYYLYKKLKDSGVKISVIARGVSFGDELEYTNELTLGRSILHRTPFDGYPSTR